MKCAIFCLLTLCAFKNVFAEPADDSVDEKVLSNYLDDDRMDGIWNKLNSDIEAASHAAKIPKMKYNEVLFKCWSRPYYPLFAKSINVKGKNCYQCYSKYKENTKIARNCCSKVVEQVQKEANSYLALANKCIAKCAQSADNCLKEIMIQKKNHAKKQLKGQNTAESQKTKDLHSEENEKSEKV